MSKTKQKYTRKHGRVPYLKVEATEDEALQYINYSQQKVTVSMHMFSVGTKRLIFKIMLSCHIVVFVLCLLQTKFCIKRNVE